MKFFQYRDSGEIKVGAKANEKCYDLSGKFKSMQDVMVSDWRNIKLAEFPNLDENSVKLASPIYNSEKCICVGLNYSDHCAEQDLPVPKEPVIFNKFASCIIGPNEPILIPKIGCDVDLEVELCVVIGKDGKHIPKDKAMEHVFGFTAANDVSGRDWQMKRNGGQWLLGKTFDTFLPLGPYIETDLDPHNLNVSAWIDGEKMQDSNTKNLIFDIPFIVNWISQICTLKVGDIIMTGTPGGVGLYRKPPKFLKPGEICKVEIEGIGTLINPVANEK